MNLRLDTPVQYIKGVGPRLGELLEKKGIRRVVDLLEYYPRAYEDRRKARNIASLLPGDIVSLKANIVSVYAIPMGKSYRKMYDVVVKDSTGQIRCKYFRVPYKGYFDAFTPGQEVRVVGKVILYRGQREFHHPDIFDLAKEEQAQEGLLPIYVETEGLSSRRVMKIMERVLADSEEIILDLLPRWILEKYKLPSRKESLQKIHRPPQQADHEFTQLKSPYHKRIIFEEFFWLELFLAIKKAGIQRETGPQMKQDLTSAEKLRQSLPFELTGAQKRAFDEIVRDMCAPHPMHRLVQGDVGSGKTIVALMSACVAVANGYQTALMAPTEILAEQHYNNAIKWLEPLGLRVALLTGSTSAKERALIQGGLAQGAIDICVGTHALIQSDVEFRSLGLAIIDEQHRFGVHQRNDLKRKGVFPHFL
ncbi:MAG: DEAD/DEAH box helicase, partial [Bdellovibrionia bacterium]